MKNILFTLYLCLFGLMAEICNASTIIETYGGVDYLSKAIREPASQTFTTPEVDTSFSSLSLWMSATTYYGTPSYYDFTVSLYLWNEQPVGNSIFESSVYSSYTSLTPYKITVDMLGVVLQPNQKYMFEVNAAGANNAFYQFTTNPYYYSGGGHVTPMYDGSWLESSTLDLAFEAIFDKPAPVPLPPSFWLFSFGLAGLFRFAKR